MVCVVDYGLGNLFSVKKAIEACGKPVIVSRDPADLAAADRIILPGVGAFGDGIARLRSFGLIDPLEQAVFTRHVPFLGICLGMQLLADDSDEYGLHQGLGWIPGHVRKLSTEEHGLKVPHIGWNDIQMHYSHPLFEGIPNGSDFYFVHSYSLQPEDPDCVAATTSYGSSIVAAIQKENMFATQFHPEKSQELGLRLLENFLAWKLE